MEQLDLNELRGRIDEMDSQLTALFLQRMEIVEQVARYKLERGMQVLQPEREQAVIDRAAARAPEAMQGYTGDFFRAVMAVSRAMQQEIIDRSKADK